MVNNSALNKANLAIHCFQVLWSVVILGVDGAAMMQAGTAGGPARFTFAMCFLNVPTLIYLTMGPRFARTRQFAHTHWIMAFNAIYVILWFAAFVSLSVYNKKGISAGMGKETDKAIKEKGGCALFPAGTGETEKACTLNTATVGLSAFMWILWLTTAGIAGYGSWYYKQHTVSPFEDLSTPSHEIQETTKDAFSSGDEYAPINRRTGAHDDYEEDDLESHAYGDNHGRSASVVSTSYAGGSAYTSQEESAVGGSGYDSSAHPGRALSWAVDREPYAGIGGHAPIAPAHNDMAMPEIPDEYSYRGGGRR